MGYDEAQLMADNELDRLRHANVKLKERVDELEAKFNAKYWEGVASDNRKLRTRIKELEGERDARR